MTGRVQSGNISATGNVNANIVNATYLYGDGSNLTNVNIATAGTLSAPNLLATGNLVGTLAANASSQPNITSIGTLTSLSVTGTSNLANVNAGNISATGNVNANIVSATYLYGDGSNLTNLSTPTSFGAGNISVSGNLTGRLSAASALQPNITTVGTLTNLSVAGTINTPAITAGNISVSGNISAPGTNTQVVFNNQGNLGGSANLVFTGTNLNVAANLNATGNIAGNNVAFAGRANITGNISTGGNITGAGNLSVTGTATVGNLLTTGSLGTTGAFTAASLSVTGNIDSGGNLNANSVTLSGEANANVVRAVYLYGDGSNISNVGTVVPRNEITRAAGYVTIDTNGFIHAGDSVNGDQYVIKEGNGLQALNKFSITDGTANYFSSNTTNTYFNLGQTAQGATFQVNATDGSGPQFTIVAPAGNTGNSVVNLNGANVTLTSTSSSNVALSSINLTDSTISVVGNLVLNSSPASSTSNTQVATTAFVQSVVSAKANIASPAFTGIPTAPTAANGTNTTQIATTQFVANAIAAGGGGGGGSNISNGNASVSTYSNNYVKVLGNTFSFTVNDSTNSNNFIISSNDSNNPSSIQSYIRANVGTYVFNVVNYANANVGNLVLNAAGMTYNGNGSGRFYANADFYLQQRMFSGGNFSIYQNGTVTSTLFQANTFSVLGNVGSQGNTVLQNLNFGAVPSYDWVNRYTTKALGNSYGSLSATITAGNINLQRAITATTATTGSIVFDNSGTNYVTIPASGDWANIGNGDLTAEGWFYYQTGGATNATLFMIGSTNKVGVMYLNNVVTLWFGAYGYSFGAVPAANTWAHIALVKYAGVWAIYVNGVLGGTPYGSSGGNNAGFAPVGPIYLGLDQTGSTPTTSYFNGRMTNFRLVVGNNTAVYKENFTPPTTDLTAIPGTSVLLLTQTSATAYTDSSGTGKLVTNNATTWNNASGFSPIVNNVSQVSLTPPTTLANYALRLPTSAGTNGQVLSTDGSGNLSWITGFSSISNANSSVSTFAYGQVVIGTGTMQAVYANTGVSMATGNVTLGNGNIILSNGIVAVQSITDINNQGFRLQGNNDTYLQHFSASSNGLNFQQWNGSAWINRVRVDSNGNVGIGTSSPISQLDLTRTVTGGSGLSFQANNPDTGASSASYVFAKQGSVTTSIYSYGNSGSYIGATSNNFAAFVTNNTERMRIDTSGNVGIGTSSPASKFNVVNGSITISDGYGYTWGNTYITGYNGNYMSFVTNAAERMRIDAAGNVGIGTVTPSYKLDIAAGTLGTTAGSIVPYQRLSSLDPGNNDYLEITNTRQTAGSAWNGAGSRLQQKVDATWMGYIQFNGGAGTTNDGGISFGTGTTTVNSISILERMRIDAAGNVGIGTVTPAAKLAVVGAITSTDNITAYYSDDRLKTKLGTIENALDKVDSLEGFYYEANETAQALGYKVKREVGVSAQQVEKVLPEIVAPAPIDNKYLTIDYERLVPLLIEAIKELRAEVNELKGRQ